MQTHTYKELKEGLHFIEMYDTEYSATNQLLATVAAEVRRSFSKHPGKVKTKDFMPRYVKKTKKSGYNMGMSKAFWGALLGGK